MKIKFNNKILWFIITITVFASVILTACERPDIYTLAENLLKSGDAEKIGLYYFTADLNIKIDRNHLYNSGISSKFGDEKLESVPGELNFKFAGKVKNSAGKPVEFEINAEITKLSELASVNNNLKTVIYGKNNLLYFEFNDMSKVIMNFLCAGGFLDAPVKNIFEDKISYEDGTVLCFDMTGIDLPWFDKYITRTEKIFKVTSNVKYDAAAAKDFSVPDIYGLDSAGSSNKPKVKYFSDIKSMTKKELLKTKNYRYAELYVILGKDSDKPGNLINILATSENGKKEILEKVKIDCDISKIKNSQSLLNEKIIPMRYILELLGETVGWDNTIQKAYIINGENGKKVYFSGNIINSKTYITLSELIINTTYEIQTGVIGDYIEFKIFRKQ